MTPYRESLVPIQCYGRGPNGRPTLGTPLPLTIKMHRSPGCQSVSVGPQNCPHNTGGHGQRCKASHPGHEKLGDGVDCPYSFDYPYATEFPGWKLPSELKAALEDISK